MPRIVGPNTSPIVWLYISEANTVSSRKAVKTLSKSKSVQFSGFFSSSGIRSLSMSVPRQTGEVLRMWLKKP